MQYVSVLAMPISGVVLGSLIMNGAIPVPAQVAYSLTSYSG